MARRLPERPAYVKDLRLDQFRAFLISRGAEALTPTNPYEVLRFKALGETHVIYQNAAGKLRLTDAVMAAWSAFRTGESWAGIAKTAPTKIGKRRPVIVRTLIERDGPGCFYCPHPIEEGEETVEHLLSQAHGGSAHVSNLVLAHGACNLKAGHLSVMEKIRLRERMLAVLKTEQGGIAA